MPKVAAAGTAATLLALVCPADASAQSATPAAAPSPLRLGLGGYFQAYGVFVSQPDGPGEYGADRRSFDIKREAEIFFSGRVRLDNGLTVGVQVELEAETCSDQIDESYLFFEGGWGRIVIGAENSPAYLLSLGPPTVDSSFDGIDANLFVVNALGSGPRSRAPDSWIVNLSGDSEKLSYFSPRIAGFQFGVAYTPDNSEEATAGQVRAKGGAFAGMPSTRQSTDARGSWSDVLSAAVAYRERFGPVRIGGSVSYERGTLSKCPAGVACGAYDDRQAWAAYVRADYAGFDLGAGYWEDDNGLRGANKSSGWGGALTYTTGPWTLGTSYFDGRRQLPGQEDDRMQRVLVGGLYQLGPGVDLRASLHWYGFDSDKPTARGDSWAVVTGTVVRF
ncbi:porin [Stella sp.]|uniref:porin n=1 Tax=Stella sp. TaxID=2912054 RepID=UPI0035B03093